MTEEELIETITHMAFYSGWPSAVSAVGHRQGGLQEELMPLFGPAPAVGHR